MGLAKCVGYGISLGETSQWMKPEQIAVNLRITGLYAGQFDLAALSRALALGDDPTPPS